MEGLVDDNKEDLEEVVDDDVDMFAIPDDIFEGALKTLSGDSEDAALAQLKKQQEQEADVVPSKCEIVSSVYDATITQTEEERHDILRLQYGDLPPEQWADRAEQEKHWVSGKLTLLQSWAPPLKDPTRCLIIGTNGTVAIALKGMDWKEPNKNAYSDPHDWTTLMPTPKKKPPTPPSEEPPSKGPKEETKEDNVARQRREFVAKRKVMVEESHRNALLAYKMAMGDFECESFKRALDHELKTRITTKAEAMAALKDVIDTSKIDLGLRPALQKIGPVLTNRINNLPETAPPPKMVMAKRPGGMPKTLFFGYEFAKLNPATKSWDSTSARKAPGATEFHVLMCGVPKTIHKVKKEKPQRKGKGKKKKKKKIKGPKWRDVNCVFVCNNNGVVPAVAFNETHMAVLYMPYVYADKSADATQATWKDNMIFVDLFKISEPTQRLDRFGLIFPLEFSGAGHVHVSLSRLGIFTVGFSCGAIIFDVFRGIKKPRVFVLKHDEPDESDGTKKRQYRVTVTSVDVVHPQHVERPPINESRKNDKYDDYIFAPVDLDKEEKEEEEEKDIPEVPQWCGHVMLGTHRGECFTFCWRSGKHAPVEMLPGNEPVFSTHYSNGRLILHGASSMSGSISSVGSHTKIPLRRPLALTTCGSLIFVLSKYGHVIVFDSFARQFCRPFNPPPQGAMTYMLQHAYQGIWASPTRVVAVYMNGIVRTIELPPKEFWPELERQAEEAERKFLEKQKKEQQELAMREQATATKEPAPKEEEEETK